MAEKETSSRAKSGMGGKSEKKSTKNKKLGRIHETHIRHYKNGGHEVTHHYKDDDGNITPGDPTMMADKASLMAHLQDTIPDNGSAQASPAPAGQTGAPQTAQPGAAQATPPQGM